MRHEKKFTYTRTWEDKDPKLGDATGKKGCEFSLRVKYPMPALTVKIVTWPVKIVTKSSISQPPAPPQVDFRLFLKLAISELLANLAFGRKQ